jgi:hypothetical protein
MTLPTVLFFSQVSRIPRGKQDTLHEDHYAEGFRNELAGMWVEACIVLPDFRSHRGHLFVNVSVADA